MTGALTVAEAFGPTLDELLTHALAQSRRPARTTTCPVCAGTMRRLPASAGRMPADGADELVCGECESTLVDLPVAQAGQLRLVR
jgi:hypothetical protein